MGKSGQMHDPSGKRKTPWAPDAKVEAVFSPCEAYRYKLSEIWNPDGPLVLWILMNPSVACTDHSEPAVGRTGAFSRAWDFGGQLAGNVYVYRATGRSWLLEVYDPVGLCNDVRFLWMTSQASQIILAFGKPPGVLQARGKPVIDLLTPDQWLSYLRLLKNGETLEHPLYVPGIQEPQLRNGGHG